MRFSLTVLGSSSALPTSKRFPSAHLLNVNERFYLIDCGEGTQMQLRKFRIGLGKIYNIFISHIHGDHVFGLFGLLSSFQLLARKTELHIFAPNEIQAIIDFYSSHFGKNLDYRIVLHPLNFSRPTEIFRDKSLTVTCFPLKHRGPTYGFLFRELPSLLNLKKEAMDIYKPGIEEINAIKRGENLVLYSGEIVPNNQLTIPPWKPRSYAYCSDTGFDPAISGIVEEVDLLYHEATFATSEAKIAETTFHSTGYQAASIAKTANVKRLLIGHYSSRYKNPEKIAEEARTVFPETEGVNDGDIFFVERVRTSITEQS